MKGVPKEKLVLFPNGVDTSAIFPLGNSSPLRAELGIDGDKIVALYSGTMSSSRGWSRSSKWRASM